MAITSRNPKRGIALLVAVIFMSVMLALGVMLASLSYKQAVLVSTTAQSQTAFYIADGALECALYADQQQQAFLYNTHNGTDKKVDPNIVPADCDGVVYGSVTENSYNANGLLRIVLSERISFDAYGSCADITVYKYASPQGAKGLTTYIFSQGYNVPCATVVAANGTRLTARGIDARY